MTGSKIERNKNERVKIKSRPQKPVGYILHFEGANEGKHEYKIL